MKKMWVKPKLVVLGRGTAEEDVLQICKGMHGTPSPNRGNSLCEDRRQDYCADCKSYMHS
jgi:hypothetical protein